MVPEDGEDQVVEKFLPRGKQAFFNSDAHHEEEVELKKLAKTKFTMGEGFHKPFEALVNNGKLS